MNEAIFQLIGARGSGLRRSLVINHRIAGPGRAATADRPAPLCNAPASLPLPARAGGLHRPQT